jgi:hypothetical protein
MLRGYIQGFFLNKSSDESHIERLGFIVDYVDYCIPNLSSPSLAFTDTLTTLKLFHQAGFAEYQSECRSREMSDSTSSSDSPIMTSSYSFADA